MVNIFTLILFNLAFFICNLYPKHLFEWGGPLPAVAMLFNLVFYVFFALFLFTAFRKNKDLLSDGVFSPFKQGTWKGELPRCLGVVGVQLGLDLILLVLKPSLSEALLYVTDFLTVSAWVAFYFLCAPKEKNLFRTRKGLAVIGILLLLLAGSFYGTYRNHAEFFALTEIYEPLSAVALQGARNAEFLFQWKNFLLDTACGALLLGVHGFLNRSPLKKRISVVLIRGFVLLLLAFLGISVKYWLFPQNCFAQFNRHGSHAVHYEGDSIPVDDELASTWTMSRISGKMAQTVYEKTNHCISDGGETLLNYDSILSDGRLSQKTAGDVTYYYYNDEVFGLVSEGELRFFCAADAAPAQSEDLTAIYKHFIEERSWLFFGQGAEYLLEAEGDFIAPYLERYAEGQFTKEESEDLAQRQIRTTYIQDLATMLLG